MTAKEYLRQYEHAVNRARRLKREYETELEQIDAIGSTLSGDGTPHGSGVTKKTESKAIRLADKAMAWKMAELDAMEVRQEVFEMIHDIPGVEGDLLYERYINLKHWDVIADELSYTERGLRYAHQRALAIVERRITVPCISANQ